MVGADLKVGPYVQTYIQNAKTKDERPKTKDGPQTCFE